MQIVKALIAAVAGILNEVALSPEVVQRVQERLAERGYDPGPVDGKWGPKTRQAVKQHALVAVAHASRTVK
jgi:peptidoglycan hydrolase-like protein with peptidoglycan-binding domain